MIENLHIKPAIIGKANETINLVEERVQPLYPVRSKHENTKIFFDTLLWCYCSALVVQLFTFMPYPHYYAVRLVNTTIGCVVLGYGVLWLVRKRFDARYAYAAMGIIMGVTIGL